MSRFKSVKTEFTALPNKVIQGFYLSAEATLVLITCLSYPNDWVYRPTHLWKNLPLSRNKIYKAFGELIEKGHCIKMEKKTKNLKSGVDYIFFDDPDVCKKTLEDKKTEFEDPDFYVTHAWNSKKDLRDSSFRETEAWNSKDGELTKKNIIKKEKQQQPAAPAAVFSCLKEIDIPQVDKEWLTAHHTEADVQHAIEYSKTQVIKNCLAATLKWAAKNKPQITVPKEQQTEQNRRYAKELLGEGKESEMGIEAVPLQKYVEIIYKRGNMQAICIEYHIANFIETLTGKLRDFSII